MADLLALCRDFTIHSKEIKEEGEEIIFDNYAWQKNAKTNFVVWGSEKNGSVKEYYPLESIVYFLKNANLTHAQFVRQSAASSILGIRLPDRQKLLDYLHGKTTTCDSIDHSVLIDISQRRIITSTTAEQQEDYMREPVNKKMRMDEVGQLGGPIDPNANSSLQAKLDLKPGGKIASDLTNSSAATNKTSNLTAVIPQDKLQMLRAKFRANHQQMIKPDDEERAAAIIGGNILQSEVSLLGSGDGTIVKKEETEAKSYASRMQLGATKAFVKEIMSREYTWRTRTSVLQSLRKTFFDTIVAGTLKTVKLKEENLHGHQHVLGPHTPFIPAGVKTGGIENGNGSKVGIGGVGVSGNVGAAGIGVNNNAPTHYSRYDQERFTQASQDTAGFKIDTMGTYHGKGLSSVMTDGSQVSRDPRKQAGRGINQDINKSPTGKQKPKSRMPIIIIPAAPTSLITMYNAKDILQDLRFEKTEDKKAGGCGRDTELLIQRQKGDGRTVPYRIVDQPSRLAPEDWDRVVAVFVQGPAWQFKGWPLGRDPVDIFAAVKAFHLKYSHMPLHPDVKKWNVEVIQLDNRRHLDKANFQKIWDALDRHMIKTKPQLRF